MAWITDPHLDALEAPGREELARLIDESGADALLVTGDISNTSTLVEDLQWLRDASRRQVYFVLGNHDYYGGSVARVRAAVDALGDGLHYLPSLGPVDLEGRTLVGCDGWGDARYGDPAGTNVVLNDFLLIEDITGQQGEAYRGTVLDLLFPPRTTLTERLQALGAAEAAIARRLLADVSGEVLFATHVPPFREACWHEGEIANDDWLPYFACGAVGEALLEYDRGPMTVLCGHTHSGGEATIREGLVVRTGPAEYGVPCIQALV